MENKIKETIKNKGLKTAFVIDKAGISKSHFYEIMNGNTEPSIIAAYKIAKVLNVPLKEIFPPELA